MNPYDHEDAFKEANIFAGNRTKIAEAIKLAKDRDTAHLIIQEAQKTYSDLFDAFIAGVDYGRRFPLTKED